VTNKTPGVDYKEFVVLRLSEMRLTRKLHIDEYTFTSVRLYAGSTPRQNLCGSTLRLST